MFCKNCYFCSFLRRESQIVKIMLKIWSRTQNKARIWPKFDHGQKNMIFHSKKSFWKGVWKSTHPRYTSIKKSPGIHSVNKSVLICGISDFRNYTHILRLVIICGLPNTGSFISYIDIFLRFLPLHLPPNFPPLVDTFTW